jgi:hypothetical protein
MTFTILTYIENIYAQKQSAFPIIWNVSHENEYFIGRERNDPRFSDQLAVDSKNVITHKNKGVHDEEKLQQCL